MMIVYKNTVLNLKIFSNMMLPNDIDGLDLFSELNVLKEIIQIKDYTPIDILNYIKRLDSFLNTCIAYRILLIIHITIASVEKSFSKLKLIKTYLRSIMS